jgi:hypothetical protein
MTAATRQGLFSLTARRQKIWSPKGPSPAHFEAPIMDHMSAWRAERPTGEWPSSIHSLMRLSTCESCEASEKRDSLSAWKCQESSDWWQSGASQATIFRQRTKRAMALRTDLSGTAWSTNGRLPDRQDNTLDPCRRSLERIDWGGVTRPVGSVEADQAPFVLRSDQDIDGTHEVSAEEVDVLHTVAAPRSTIG